MDHEPLSQEFKGLLAKEGVAAPVNLQVDDAPDGYLRLQIMSASTDRLGPVLAALSRPDELDDHNSLSSRITSSGRAAGHWRYQLTMTRYPHDRTLVFLVTIFLPADDLPEVMSRLRTEGKPADSR